MDEGSFQRIRNIISKCPKKQITWSQLTNKHYTTDNDYGPTYDSERVEKLRILVKDFLEVGKRINKHIHCPTMYIYIYIILCSYHSIENLILN